MFPGVPSLQQCRPQVPASPVSGSTAPCRAVGAWGLLPAQLSYRSSVGQGGRPENSCAPQSGLGKEPGILTPTLTVCPWAIVLAFICFIVLLCRLDELICVGCLEQCLAESDCSVHGAVFRMPQILIEPVGAREAGMNKAESLLALMGLIYQGDQLSSFGRAWGFS